MFDGMSFNPAMTGFKGYCATAIYRGQWDKVENAPNTMLVNAQASLPNIGVGNGGSGVGISFMNDVIGLGKEMDIKLNYAYHQHFQTKGFLSAGLGLGIESVGFDPKWVVPNPTALDPNLPLNASGTGFDVNFGLHWKGETVPYFVGVSMTHLTSPTLKNVNFTKARSYYVNAGLKINQVMVPLMPERLDITPSFLFKTDAAAGIVDFNVMANWWMDPSSGNMGLFGGVTYRTKDAFALLVGFQIKKYPGSLGGDPDGMKIGYSYDAQTGPLNQYGGGSHELMFNYCMFKPAPPVRRYGNVFILQ
jgi:type IX secretion system PorP/SprF family membrane protein